MRRAEKTAEGVNYVALSVGGMNQLGEHSLVLAPGVEIPGKVFLGKALSATGAEVSFQSFAPNTETGFLHSHKTHEELYLFVSGHGQFQVDNEVFPIAEGTVVRVAPQGKRSVRNTGNDSLIMICIQYKASTFSKEDASDGVILEDKVAW